MPLPFPHATLRRATGGWLRLWVAGLSLLADETGR